MLILAIIVTTWIAVAAIASFVFDEIIDGICKIIRTIKEKD